MIRSKLFSGWALAAGCMLSVATATAALVQDASKNVVVGIGESAPSIQVEQGIWVNTDRPAKLTDQGSEYVLLVFETVW